MSLFKKQLTAAREARVEVDLQTEDSVATESLGEDVSQEIDVDAIMDQFAEDRDRLNAMLEDGSIAEGVAVESLDGGAEVIEASVEVASLESDAAVATENLTEVTEGEVVTEQTSDVEQAEAPVVAEGEAVPVEQQVATEVVTQTEEVTIEQEAEVIAEQSENIVQEAPVEQRATNTEDGVTQEVDTNEDLPDDAVPGYTDDDEDDETMVAEMAVMEEISSDVMMIEQYGRDMTMIADSIVAIESFGINPSAIAILQTTGLLSDTVLEAVGVESLGYAGPNDAQTMIALEALEAKADDKAAGWSAKILSMTKSVGSKIMSVLGGIWEKITGTVKAIGGYTWDKAKAAGAVVKAHPYKTILGVVAAIAAVAGITVFISGGLPALVASGKTGAVANKFVKFGETVAAKASAIKWPFGKVAAEAAEGTGKLSLAVTSNMAAPEAATLGKMGWTQTVVKGVESTLGRAWGGIKTGAETLTEGASKFGSFAKDNTTVNTFKKTWTTFNKAEAVNAGRVFKTGLLLGKGEGVAATVGQHAATYVYFAFGAGVIKFIYGLIFKVVAFGLRVIYNTLKAIAGAVKGSSTATA